MEAERFRATQTTNWKPAASGTPNGPKENLGDPEQETAVLMVTGQLMTDNGDVLSRVKVKVENLSKQRQLETKSNAEGIYRVIFFNPSGLSGSPIAEVGDQLKIQVFQNFFALNSFRDRAQWKQDELFRKK